MRRLASAFVLSLLVCGGSAAWAAEPRQAIVGSDGVVYTVRSGLARSLFPHTVDGVAPASPVLALDVLRPGAGGQRLLVPGTTGSDAEVAPTLVFEDASHSVFVLWQSRSIGGRSQLELASWNGETWSQVIEVSGDPSTSKGPARLSVTRRELQSNGGATRAVTVVHLVWTEPGAGPGATTTVLYAPIVLEDGAYIGWNPVVELSSVVSDVRASAVVAPADLAGAVAVDAGRDPSSAVVAFIDVPGGRLITAETRVLPVEVSRLVQDLTARIEQGVAAGTELTGLAGDVRAHIVGRSDLHPALAAYLAEAAAARILAAQGTSLASDGAGLADDVRAHIVGVATAAILGVGGGVRAPAHLELVEVSSLADGGLPTHLLALRSISVRALPELGAAPYGLYVSRDGEHQILAWSGPGGLRYRESTRDGWSDVLSLVVPQGADPDELLTARVNGR